MGAVNSKSYIYYKRRKEDVNKSLFRDLERLRGLSKTRLHRLSTNIENMTCETQPHGYKIGESVKPSISQTDMFISPHNIDLRSLQSVRTISLDDHPVVTKLQNKQNARLENMEQRMDRIRNSAMQAAERRKFAYMFKTTEVQTNKLLKEATYALEEMKRQQKQGLLQNAGLLEEDPEEIIPIKILPGVTTRQDKMYCKEAYKEDQNILIGGLKLNLITNKCSASDGLPFSLDLATDDPVTWLLLPLLLPIMLIVYLMYGIMSIHPNNKLNGKNMGLYQ